MQWRASRVLALAPHTDDAELGAGGTIRKAVSSGAEVHYVALSIARESVPDGLPEDILSREVKDATRSLGIPEGNLEVLDYPVRRLPEYRQDILECLIRLRSEVEPDLVLVTAGSDMHQDHHTVYEEAVRAFKTTTILGYELPWNTIEFRAHTVIALTDEDMDTKIAALEAYQSQRHRHYASEGFVRSWARMRGAMIGVAYAEAFEGIRWVIR